MCVCVCVCARARPQPHPLRKPSCGLSHSLADSCHQAKAVQDRTVLVPKRWRRPRGRIKIIQHKMLIDYGLPVQILSLNRGSVDPCLYSPQTHTLTHTLSLPPSHTQKHMRTRTQCAHFAAVHPSCKGGSTEGGPAGGSVLPAVWVQVRLALSSSPFSVRVRRQAEMVNPMN